MYTNTLQHEQITTGACNKYVVHLQSARLTLSTWRRRRVIHASNGRTLQHLSFPQSIAQRLLEMRCGMQAQSLK